MYQYFYDFFLSEEKYGKILALVESRLTDLGMQGRTERLNLFKDPGESIAEGMKRGVKTIVAVGNEATLTQVINGVKDADLTVGFIPIGPQNEIAKILGIAEGTAGCDCLANRLTQKIDLGEINGQYFLSHVRTLTEGVFIRCGSDYRIRPVANHRVEIYNLPGLVTKADPLDGYLEVRVRSAGGNSERATRKNNSFFGGNKRGEGKETFFPIKKIFLESGGGGQIAVDGIKTINTPAEVRVMPQKLKIIVGKNRFF